MVFLLGAAPFLFLQTATGEGCKFPFKLNGISEEFFDCVRLYANNRGEYEEISSGDPWCPLELESDGSYVIGAKLKYCKSESLPEVGFPGQTASTSNVESPNLKPDSMDRECSVSSDCGKEEYCKTIHAIDEFLGTQCRDKLAQGDVCDSADSCQNGLVCKSWNELGEDPIMDGPSGRCEVLVSGTVPGDTTDVAEIADQNEGNLRGCKPKHVTNQLTIPTNATDPQEEDSYTVRVKYCSMWDEAAGEWKLENCENLPPSQNPDKN